MEKVEVPLQNIEAEVKSIFELQKINLQNLKNTSKRERINKLYKLKKSITEHLPEIQEAIYLDFRKSEPEVNISEVFPVITSIKHTIKHLGKWMRAKPVMTPLNMIGSHSKVLPEPKGNCLIIAPWNYPFQLLIDPLVYAIAAGNAVILKPSEITPSTSAFIKKWIPSIFPENEIAVLEGGIEVSQNLLAQPFDHIFFTGSPQVGKVVMEAASKNLTSVTLELGGKSPVIIDETANLKDAAQKIVYGKLLNAGQTCIAPDYLLVQDSIKTQLITEIQNSITTYFGENPQKSSDYTRIVNTKHYQRLKSWYQDAKEKGAKTEIGGNFDDTENYISPTVLSNIDEDMVVMQEEVFGAILPIKTFSVLEQAIEYINHKPKPLALYIFSKSKKNQKFLLNHTSAGGTSINETLAHIAHPNLPFGGVNNSGMGKTHGYYGFRAFSNERAILKQRIGLTTLKFLYPPYTNRVKKMIQFFLK